VAAEAPPRRTRAPPRAACLRLEGPPWTAWAWRVPDPLETGGGPPRLIPVGGQLWAIAPQHSADAVPGGGIGLEPPV
jgi:hypothetical protein